MDDRDPLTEQLDRNRRDIEALDRRILHLVRERLEVASEIGDLKQRLGIPLRNFRVEASVLERFSEASSFLGLDAGLGRDLALFLIGKAVEHQAEHRDTRYDGDALQVVVVGGKGGMGRWITRLLLGQGHRVSIHDPAEGEAPATEVDDLSAVRDADLVLVSVPLGACPDVLRAIADHQPRGVVAEMCSLKHHLAESLAEVRQRGVRAISFHPMFGPSVRMLSDRTVVFMTDAPEADVEVVRRLFADTSARLVAMDPVEHDRRMRAVLGLTHLMTLVYARALERSGLAVADLAEVAGVTFDRQIGATRELAWENPELFYEIQHHLPAGEGPSDWLAAAVEDWQHLVQRDDRGGFVDLMRSCRESIGDPGMMSEKGTS
jgi:chorismate mutase/prephenate dehydrogenase